MTRATTGLVAVAGILGLAPALPAEDESFSLDAARAVLRAGGDDLKPIAVLSSPPEGALIGDLRVRIDGARVVAVRALDGREAWTADAKEGNGVGVHAVGHGLLWCTTWKKDPDAGDEKPRLPVRPGVVRRLRIADGKWVDTPLALPEPATEGARAELIDEVLPLPAGAIVVSALPWKKAIFEAGGALRITRFQGEPPAPAWSRVIPYRDQYSGPVGAHAGYVLSEGGFSGRRTATLAGDHLVLCPSARDGLVALALDTGEEAWRLERPGDWERWFIGPSVWASGIALPDETGKKNWRIYGGPVAVPYDRGDGTAGTPYTDRPAAAKPGYRLFLNVAREKVENRPEEPEGKAAEWKTVRHPSDVAEADSGGHNADTIVYEVNDRGLPVAMAALPREASLSPRTSTVGGALFLGDERYGVRMAWLVPTFQHQGSGMNGTSPHWARVAWWRHLPENPSPPKAKQVFRLPRYYDRPRAAGPTTLYRLGTGAFVTVADPSTLRFPLVRTDLATGADEPLVLQVPFKGPLPRDKFESSHEESEEGWTPGADGPPAAFVSGLDLAGTRLYLTVTTAGAAPTLFVFDIPER